MVEHISAADAKPPNGPDDGVGLALADAGSPVEEDDGVPAAADPPPGVEHPDSASAAKRATVRYRIGPLRGLEEIFKGRILLDRRSPEPFGLQSNGILSPPWSVARMGTDLPS